MRPLRPAFALSLALAGCGPDKPTSSASDTTTGAPVCQASEDCPDGQACLLIICNGHGLPGCPFFACVDGCALPGAATPTWSCVDKAGCCGDAVCENGFCIDATATGTASTSATTGGATTGGAAPPPCMSSSDCPGDGNCLNKSCDLVDGAPGCGEFRCYAECSDPFSDAAFWTCADDQACCGGYPCLAGSCTEYVSST